MSFFCVYIFKNKKQKKNQKKIQDFQIFPKKRENFSNDELGALVFLVTFSKRTIFFL